jgi:hypothetical protein
MEQWRPVRGKADIEQRPHTLGVLMDLEKALKPFWIFIFASIWCIPNTSGRRKAACMSGRREPERSRVRACFLGMRVAGVHFPPFALPVDERAVTGDRCGAMLGVPYTEMDEPKALAGLDVEGFGVMGHS